MNVRLADDPQAFRLQFAMSLECMRRGDKARVSIPNVRIAPLPGSFAEKGELYFCEIGPLRNVQRIRVGKGKSLPKKANLIGILTAEGYGYGDLHGVELSSDAETLYVNITSARFVPQRTAETITPEMMEEAGKAVRKLIENVTENVVMEEEGG